MIRGIGLIVAAYVIFRTLESLVRLGVGRIYEEPPVAVQIVLLFLGAALFIFACAIAVHL